MSSPGVKLKLFRIEIQDHGVTKKPREKLNEFLTKQMIIEGGGNNKLRRECERKSEYVETITV